MTIVRRMVGVGLSTVAMVSAMAAFGPSAQAATAAGTSCTNTGSGSLCLAVDPKGYDISYHKLSGGKAHVDFNLVCDNGRWFGDEGSFSISAGQVRTYVFSVGSQGACRGKLIDKTTGSTWLTGKVSR
ncbi:hypothetical protein ADL22_30050 [Streptomyces sp. NRRL F-4489]|uniref:hypothetical protein n=1 Tax=Streptomyces sp. NRRL F-4489 TaxID=1609095 RepID=UPI0007482E05|nr:hypothetical protein [Streptomyces sp. NRRL F-4489]KUL34670.1 hypothetical protein ADL22_30050 [Streptomyces sp. NRRL F-4489]